MCSTSWIKLSGMVECGVARKVKRIKVALRLYVVDGNQREAKLRQNCITHWE